MLKILGFYLPEYITDDLNLLNLVWI